MYELKLLVFALRRGVLLRYGSIRVDTRLVVMSTPHTSTYSYRVSAYDWLVQRSREDSRCSRLSAFIMNRVVDVYRHIWLRPRFASAGWLRPVRQLLSWVLPCWLAKCCVFTHCDKLCACVTVIYCSTANPWRFLGRTFVCETSVTPSIRLWCPFICLRDEYLSGTFVFGTFVLERVWEVRRSTIV